MISYKDDNNQYCSFLQDSVNASLKFSTIHIFELFELILAKALGYNNEKIYTKNSRISGWEVTMPCANERKPEDAFHDR